MRCKINLLLVVSLLIFISTSCKQQEAQTDEEIIVHLPDEFVNFHSKFHKDSIFQINHIVFPLEGKITPDGLDDFWHQDNWIMHKEFDQSFTNYKRDYTVLSDLVIEKIFDSFQAFSMERRFAKVLGNWNLIYYRVTYKNPGLEVDTTE